ncbi:MAG: hypothetical protein FJ109_01750 [Deltaproteobacteria bacterium]|nr:hypothetical protein [Deltaproteobacteria bacterium]
MRVALARYVRTSDNYFFDLFDAAAAGALNRAGHFAVVAERTALAGFDEDDLVEGLVSFLSDFAPRLVQLSYLPSQVLARRVKEATGAAIVAVGSRLLLECPWVDYVLSEPDPLALLQLVEVLEGKRSPGEVAALSWRDGEQVRTSETGLHAMHEIFSRCPVDYDAFFRMGPGRPAEIRKHIAGDWGCTYRHARGPVLPPGCPAGQVHSGGCTFCLRPAAHPLEWELKRDMLAGQIDAVVSAFPAIRKLILIDEHALSFADDLARLVLTRPLDGVDLLLSGRLDHVARYRGPLETALSMLEGRNTLRLYQFGIENLADSVLERYNKGIRFEDILRACATIRELSSAHPNLCIEPSFGFILFDPWTTLDELRENAERARLVDLVRLRGDAPHTSLRLFPETPLYWKAVHDGLLTGTIDDNDFGYSVESGWQFRHADTAAVFDRLNRYEGDDEPWDVLARLVDRG